MFTMTRSVCCVSLFLKYNYFVYLFIHLQVDNFHSVLHLLWNMVPPSIESMSHSSSTSKDKDGNDDKNNSQEDDNISEIILHQKDSKCIV